MTDTAELADIVLPATTQLEQFDVNVLLGPPVADVGNAPTLSDNLVQIYTVE